MLDFHAQYLKFKFLYRRFHIKGTWSVHLFNGDYPSIPEGTGSCGYLFQEIPGTCWFVSLLFCWFVWLLFCCVFGCWVVGLLDRLDFWFLGWIVGLLGVVGELGCWVVGLLDWWLFVCWVDGLFVCWVVGLTVWWFVRTLVCWVKGLYAFGFLVCWVVELLGCWVVRLLGCCVVL